MFQLTKLNLASEDWASYTINPQCFRQHGTHNYAPDGELCTSAILNSMAEVNVLNGNRKSADVVMAPGVPILEGG
jgi:hypothetical protein